MNWRVIIALNFPILSNRKEEPCKNQGFNGIRTRNLRDTGAMLYQLSYENWYVVIMSLCQDVHTANITT